MKGCAGLYRANQHLSVGLSVGLRMGLTAKQVVNAAEGARLSDGNGLYLRVRGGKKRWTYLYQLRGVRREMGLGGYPDVSLSEARQKAGAARSKFLRGEDPLAAKEAEAVQREAGAWTFETYALKVLEDRKAYWKEGSNSARSWKMTLRLAAPLNKLRLDDIDTQRILELVRPIWVKTPENGHNLRMRLEMIFDSAIAERVRLNERNPACWKANLDRLLPKRKRLVKGHFPAMPYPDAPGFVQGLAELRGLGPIAMKMIVLTAARPSMVMKAQWSEIEGDVWTIPALRMKSGKEFQVPLSKQVMALLKRLPKTSPFLFPSERKKDQPLHRSALRVAGKGDATSHGFRSTFKDWAMEKTDYSWELSEQALAHVVGDATARAYHRSTALEKRRPLMQAWGDFLLPDGQ